MGKESFGTYISLMLPSNVDVFATIYIRKTRLYLESDGQRTHALDESIRQLRDLRAIDMGEFIISAEAVAELRHLIER